MSNQPNHPLSSPGAPNDGSSGSDVVEHGSNGSRREQPFPDAVGVSSSDSEGERRRTPSESPPPTRTPSESPPPTAFEDVERLSSSASSGSAVDSAVAGVVERVLVVDSAVDSAAVRTGSPTGETERLSSSATSWSAVDSAVAGVVEHVLVVDSAAAADSAAVRTAEQLLAEAEEEEDVEQLPSRPLAASEDEDEATSSDEDALAAGFVERVLAGGQLTPRGVEEEEPATSSELSSSEFRAAYLSEDGAAPELSFSSFLSEELVFMNAGGVPSDSSGGEEDPAFSGGATATGRRVSFFTSTYLC